MKKIYMLAVVLSFLFSANSLYAVDSLDVAITAPIKDSSNSTVVVTSNQFDLTFTTTGEPTACWYDLGGDQKFILEGCENKNITLPEGDYVLNLWVEDALGSSTFDSTWFKVIVPFSIDIINPIDKSVLNDNQFDLSFTTTEDPVSCWYDLGGLVVEDGVIVDDNDPTYKYMLADCENTTITLPNGEYILNLYALNSSEEEALDSHWFSVNKPAEPVVKEKNRRSSGSAPGRVLGASTIDEGRVLGATTSCGIYVDKYLRRGYDNDVESVKRVQKFLNDHMKAGLTEDGFYGLKTEQAVKEFQRQNASTVLAPWNISDPTGIFYITTQLAVNNTICPDLKLSNPNPENLISFSKNNLTPKKK